MFWESTIVPYLNFLKLKMISFIFPNVFNEFSLEPLFILQMDLISKKLTAITWQKSTYRWQQRNIDIILAQPLKLCPYKNICKLVILNKVIKYIQHLICYTTLHAFLLQ